MIDETAETPSPSPLESTRRGVGRDMLATMERIRTEAGEPKLNPLAVHDHGRQRP